MKKIIYVAQKGCSITRQVLVGIFVISSILITIVPDAKRIHWLQWWGDVLFSMPFMKGW